MAASSDFSSQMEDRQKASFAEVASGQAAPTDRSLTAQRVFDYSGYLAGLSTDLQDTVTGALTSNTFTITFPGASGKVNFLDGVTVTGLGATTGTNATLTITGATSQMKYTVGVPSGVTVPLVPHNFEYNRPIPSSQTNGAIVVTLSGFGSGNTNATLTAHGHQSALAQQ